MQKNRQEFPSNPVESAPGSAAPSSLKTDDLSGGSFGDKHRLLKFYREELVKLRTTWEQQVRAAEQVSASLKSPLIESYRRENELMSAMIDRLEAIRADVSAPQELPEASPLPSPEPLETEAPAAPESIFKLSDNPRTGLNQIQKHLESFGEQGSKDQDILRRIKEDFGSTLRLLESREYKTLPSLIVFVRQWQQKVQPMGRDLEETEERMNALTAEWNTLHAAVRSLASGPKESLSLSWKEQLKPRMEQVLSAARKALDAQHYRLKTHEDMIERFCSEARQLAA